MASFSVLFSAFTLLATSLAAPAPAAAPLVVHEKRYEPLRVNGARVERNAIIPVRIALAQNNLESGYEHAMQIADPSSPLYGKHLTADEVHDMFAPSDEATKIVTDWLVSAGIRESDILQYENKGWLSLDVPVEQAERLFATEYYEHAKADSVHIGCDEYSLPAHVAPHVDFVKPGIKLSSPLRKRTIDKRDGEVGPPTSGYARLPRLQANPFPDYVPPPAAANIAPNLRNCGANISIQCIQALYKLPRNKYSDPANAMGLFETGDAFSVEDIGLFFAKFVHYVPPNTVPQVISVDGGEAPVPYDSSRNTGESDIDIDLAQSIIYPQKIIVYQVDDLPNSSGQTGKAGFLNTFLDSVDGSYCNYTAFGITGDSPKIDATYPDPLPGGYKGKLQCGTYKLTRVVSISYGEAEFDLPKKYVQRQCNEFMKLGMQGHSILVAAGDYGVASFPNSDGNEFGCLPGNKKNVFNVYNPDYPAGCPFITVVGGTRLYPKDTVLAEESAMQVNLTAFNLRTGSGPTTAPFDFFATGGGFSNYFTPPSYQASAVSNYLAKYGPKVKSYVANANATNIGANGGVYNRAGRGYPDVAANGAFLRVFNNATEFTFFGTSLSSPIFGAVLTLINEERTAAGKGPVGFVNPVFYKNPGIFNDITKGSNPNCGSSGFNTAPGWDPVTGLGTPNYPKMLKLFMSLP